MIEAGKDRRSSALLVCPWEIANDTPLAVSNGLPRLQPFHYEVLRVKGLTPYLIFEAAKPVAICRKALVPGNVVVIMTGPVVGKRPACVPTGPRGEGSEEYYLCRCPPLGGRGGR